LPALRLFPGGKVVYRSVEVNGVYARIRCTGWFLQWVCTGV